MKEIIKNAFNSSNLKKHGVYFDFDNGFTNTSEKIPAMVKTQHNISKQTPVYVIFYSKKTKNGDFFTSTRVFHFSTCITEDGISLACIVQTDGWAKEEDVDFFIPWNEMDTAKHQTISVKNENNNPNALFLPDDSIIALGYNNVIQIYSKADHLYINIPVKYFADINISDNINKVLNTLEERDKEFDKAIEIIEQYNENKEYDKLIDFVKRQNLWNTDNFYINGFIIDSLLELGRKEEAEEKFTQLEKDYQEFISNLSNEEHESRNAIELMYRLIKGDIHKHRGNFYEAAESLHLAMDTGLVDGNKQIEKNKQEAYEQYIQSFNHLPYEERRVITMTNTDKLFKTDNLTLLQMNLLPEIIKFPIAHPKKDQTYICHPWNHNIYLPIEDYDMELLNDRINEFCYIMQCLGATSIQIKNQKGEEHFEGKNEHSNTNVEISKMKNKVGGNYESDSTKKENKRSRYTFDRNQYFNPTKKPYIPKDLVWFSHEATWQRLATQRLNGAILEHSEKVSSSQNKILTQNEMRDINADLETLWINVKGGRKTTDDYTISMNEEVEWEISVTFKPIEEFDNTPKSFSHIIDAETIEPEATHAEEYTQEELQYIDEVKYMLEDDDEIDDKEQQILERFRLRLKLSEERAEELKNIVLNSGKQPQLTDAEREYLADYKIFIQDGKIQERERKSSIEWQIF